MGVSLDDQTKTDGGVDIWLSAHKDMHPSDSNDTYDIGLEEEAGTDMYMDEICTTPYTSPFSQPLLLLLGVQYWTTKTQKTGHWAEQC